MLIDMPSTELQAARSRRGRTFPHPDHRAGTTCSVPGPTAPARRTGRLRPTAPARPLPPPARLPADRDRLVEGNLEKPFGESFIGGPSFIKPGAYHHIDGSLYSEGDDAWLVLHNNLYAKFRDDMEDIVPTTDLPAFRQTPYTPEPYLEGAYVFKHGGSYFLLHAAWDRTSVDADGTARQAYAPAGAGRVQYQYDAVAAVSDSFEGPYSERWTVGVGAGHNNFFEDAHGDLWATFFRNPNFGHWSNPSRLADAAVPGVVRVEWTGPGSNRLYVRRRDH